MDKQKPNYCRLLRAKNAYGTLEGGEEPWLPIDTGTTTYWCLHTGGPVGPDNDFAHTSKCGPDRQCHQANSED